MLKIISFFPLCIFFSSYTLTRYVEALGHFEAASSVYLTTLKFFYGNQKNVSYTHYLSAIKLCTTS